MAEETTKKRVLFMCIHNAGRSQIVEAFFREFYGDSYDVHSAGSDPLEIDHHALQVMAEIGIDISHQTSNSLKDYEGQEFDYVITVCGNSYNACPFFVGGKKYFKQPFEDPSSFTGPEEKRLEIFRQLRDELGDWVQDLYNYQIRDVKRCSNPGCDLKPKSTDGDESCC